MASAMGDHCIAQAVFAIKPTEKQTNATVEKEATKEYHRCCTNHHNSYRKMSCRKQERRNDICHDKNARALFLEELFEKKRHKRHHKQSKHNLFDYRTVGNRRNQVGNRRLDGIRIRDHL